MKEKDRRRTIDGQTEKKRGKERETKLLTRCSQCKEKSLKKKEHEFQSELVDNQC